jgi:hypothetical protein
MNNGEAIARLSKLSRDGLGRLGEEIWPAVIKAAGLRYIPLARIETGSAPKLDGASKTVLPDFDVYGFKRAVWLESKAKTRCVLFRLATEERHGIDRAKLEQYLRCRSETRKRCGLAILELFKADGKAWSGTLLIESLANLGMPIAGFGNQEHMVYWPRKRFVDLDTWSPAEVVKRAAGAVCPSYRTELMRIFSVGVEEFQAALF